MVKVKVLTNSGWKYIGELISEESYYVKILDEKEGEIKIPLANISMIKEVDDDN